MNVLVDVIMKNSTKAILAISAVGLAGATYVLLKQTQGLVAKSFEVSLSETKSFTISVAAPFGICVQAIVRDVGQNLTWYWSFVANAWSPGTARVRPGAGQLGLSFQARNISGAGNLTLIIKDDAGATLTTQTLAAGSVGGPNQYVQTTEVIVDMPDREYGITMSVSP